MATVVFPGTPWPYPVAPMPPVEPSFRGVMDKYGAGLLAVLGGEEEEEGDEDDEEEAGSAKESSARGDRGRAGAGVIPLLLLQATSAAA